MFDLVAHVWKTGNFGRSNVFRADDPGRPTFFARRNEEPVATRTDPDTSAIECKAPFSETTANEANEAGIPIDLSRIVGKK